MDIESHPFDLRECVESALDLVSTRATEKHLDMAYVFEGDVPAAISGDLTRLRQILLNLLANAVKFTERGEVVLTVTSAPIGRRPRRPDLRGARHRHRPQRRGPVAPVPVVLAGRLEHDAQVRRHRPRPGDQQAAGRADGRADVGRERRAGPAARPSRSRSRRRSPTLPPTRRRDFVGAQPELAGQARAGRRRQRDQPAHPGAADRASGAWSRATPSRRREALAGCERRGARGRSTSRSSTCTCPRWTASSSRARIRALAPTLPLVLFSSLGRREAGDVESLFNAYLAKPLRQSQLFDTLVEPARRTTPWPSPRSRTAATLEARPAAWRRATRCASCSPRTTS